MLKYSTKYLTILLITVSVVSLINVLVMYWIPINIPLNSFSAVRLTVVALIEKQYYLILVSLLICALLFLTTIAIRRQVKYTALEIPQSQQKNVYVISNELLSPACGCHYFPFEDIAFWDHKKHLLCIGNPYSAGQAVEFTNKTIAIIEDGKLTCVYLSLNSISGDIGF